MQAVLGLGLSAATRMPINLLQKENLLRGVGLTIRFSWNLDWETSRTISHQQCTNQAEKDNEVQSRPWGHMTDFNYESAEAVTVREDAHNRSRGQQKMGTEQTTESIWVPSLGKTLRKKRAPKIDHDFFRASSGNWESLISDAAVSPNVQYSFFLHPSLFLN